MSAESIVYGFIDGCYQFWWQADLSIIETHRAGNPQPTNRWIRKDMHLVRSNDSPPKEPWRQKETDGNGLR